VRVNIDYHIEVDRHYYSVPYPLVGEQLEARSTANTVELFHRGKRVASHVRNFTAYHHSTVREHMPLGIPDRYEAAEQVTLASAQRHLCNCFQNCHRKNNECERIPVVANAPHRDGARDISRKPQGTRILD
jgi:hypothetical protein